MDTTGCGQMKQNKAKRKCWSRQSSAGQLSSTLIHSPRNSAYLGRTLALLVHELRTRARADSSSQQILIQVLDCGLSI